jgi:hypothetical protein
MGVPKRALSRRRLCRAIVAALLVVAASSRAHAQTAAEHAQHDQHDAPMPGSRPELVVHAFGSVDWDATRLPDNPNSFMVGQLALFVTSAINDRVSVLAEVVMEATNPYTRVTTDLERLQLTSHLNDHLNISAGRYHTGIGYYNAAFHHGSYFETPIGRPRIFAFEAKGGVLPDHEICVSVRGKVPKTGSVLYYVAEVGNGRESRLPQLEEPVQNVISDKNHKAVNVELFARPAKVPGLQIGFSAYRDLLVPAGQPPIGETILAAHAIYSTPTFEWLNEALVVRHTPQDGHTFATPGWYSQISKRFGSYRPYFRYQYINASPNEPLFPAIGLNEGPSAGLRYDASESVALKLQYDFTSLRNQPSVQGLEAQVGFTF